MGRSRTPRYIIRYRVLGTQFTPGEWKVKDSGKPTTQNIDKAITALEDSMKPGGCNAHIGQFQVLSAEVYDQQKGEVAARWGRKAARPNQPMFQAI